MAACKGFKFHIYQILVAIDQLGNTILGGYADETISARTYRVASRGHWYGKVFVKIIDSIFKLLGDENHCYSAYQTELNGGHTSDSYNTN